MQTRFIEASNHQAGGMNWGKFMVARFSPEEWERKSTFGGLYMLPERGWTPSHLLVVDLQTGEGALFRQGGHALSDLNKHRIWVCPLFEQFLEWLYKQDVSNLEKLPPAVHIDNPASAFYGYRRPGPQITRTRNHKSKLRHTKERGTNY